jgi:hypothetical protein
VVFGEKIRDKMRVGLRTMEADPGLKKLRLSKSMENQGLNTRSAAWEKSLSMRVQTSPESSLAKEERR